MTNVEMSDTFITDLFEDYKIPANPKYAEVCNRILKRLKVGVRVSLPISTGQMTSAEQRIDMFHLLRSVLVQGVEGDLVELGCNAGKSAVLFAKVMAHYAPERTLHVYDSFEGLPDLRHEDGSATPSGKGSMATTRSILESNFRRHGLALPEIHQGWFDKTLPTGLPERIAFAHLDGDLYESILISLEHTYPKMSPGAVCLIDDYADPAVFASLNTWPGVKQACDEYFADKPERVAVLYGGYDGRRGFGSHGYFRKL